MAVRTSGSLSAGIIEPETSIRNTRLRGGRRRRSDLTALQPDERELVLGVPGADGELRRDRKRLIAFRVAGSRSGSN